MQVFSAVFLLILTLAITVEAKTCPRECSCDSTKLSTVCVGKNLTEIPPTIEEITVKLDLRNNNLQVLSRGAFLHTPYLTHLNLQRCNIIEIKEGAFRTLGRAVSLNLAHNKIEILYQESFDGLSSLKELHLDHNRIEEIQPGAFTQLSFLNVLALSHNQLVYIPNMAFQGLQNIKWLRLSHNSLNNLAPEAFAGLFTLSRLNLDHNELQFFPTETMTRLREVTRLDMSHNPMIYLGEESVSMAKLTHLYLNHMSLQDLSDKAFSQAPLLTHLDLSHNQLRYLEPPSGPKELTSLNLTGNPIYCNCYMQPLRQWVGVSGVKLLGACSGPPHLSDEPLQAVAPLDLRCRSREGSPVVEEEDEDEDGRVPPTVTVTAKPKQKAKCPANCECDTEAQHATCEGRGHTKIPRGFPAKTQLLDLRVNHFHYLPTNSFPGSGQVVSLHLQFCKIHEIEGGALQGMKNLLYLYLSDNDLRSLDPKAFAGAPRLTYLHLERNRLAQFPGSALSLLPSLSVLHLEENAISKLEASGLPSSVSSKLSELYLSNNNLTVIAKGALDSVSLIALHLDSNQLTEVPTHALLETPNLQEFNLSRNSVHWVGPKAFQPISQSLKRLYMDHMGMEKISRDALLGLGSGLQTLTMRGNQLKELPDLSPLSNLEVVDLRDNPLQCDCSLLPLRRWMENVSLEVAATCGHPPDLRGQKVQDIHIFKSCPENISPPEKTVVDPKVVKSKPNALKSQKVKARPAQPRGKVVKPPRKQPQRKPGTPKITKKKKTLK
ncbi:chondroadherin-like protein [Archocentrus centrarchus]|uniref:chondroadherin-like protein n=1 Tax=Archocentrus centrarchus TaxID=63155 RepID=UPI0011E9E22C|nr:chondroadherin-like protein [Archocentrus centrarchus]